MNKQIEALKMAIEWIEADWKPTNKEAVLKACKEALEQPAQSACEECIGFNKQLADENDSLKSRIAELQRYAEAMINRPTNHAPSWQSLSDDEIATIWMNESVPMIGTKFKQVYVAIEQALKEKNHA